MTPIEEIFYNFDVIKDSNDFLIWLNENRDRLHNEENDKLDNSFENGYDLGWDEALNKDSN